MIIFTLVGSLQESKVKQISAEEEAGETVEQWECAQDVQINDSEKYGEGLMQASLEK